MVKVWKFSVALLAALIGLGVCFFIYFNSKQQKINTHLQALEYWQRQLFDQATKMDYFSLNSLLDRKRKTSPTKKIESAVNELLKLGYLTNVTFELSRPMVNRKDYETFRGQVINTIFIDTHWSYSINSNKLEATIHPPDALAWRNIIESWNDPSTNVLSTNVLRTTNQ